MRDTALQHELVVHGKGVLAATTTAAAGSVTWMEHANQVVDLVSGCVAVVAGIFTIAWYASRFIKVRGVQPNEDSSSE